ncbi:AGROH133_08824 family phage infection protein [Rhizobium sp. PAMB 3174]
MEFYFPEQFGEQLAFAAATVTALLGLLVLLAPGLGLRLLSLQPTAAAGLAEARSTIGGFYLGFGVAAIMLAQDWIYLALGAAFAAALFGRILSLLVDRAFGLKTLLPLLLQLVLGGLPLSYVFGLFQ